MLKGSRIPGYLSEMVATHPRMEAEFTYRGREQDRLFDAAYDHYGSEHTCDTCETSRLVARPARDRHDPVIHYGLIASSNQVIKHGGTRDKLGRELKILCFEMEAAGLMDNFPCLMIRVARVAAYAKKLLSVIQPTQVEETLAAIRVTENISFLTG